MVKAIKESLKKLELGSKLRQEVWDREIGKSVIPHFSFSPPLNALSVWRIRALRGLSLPCVEVCLDLFNYRVVSKIHHS